MEASEAWNQLGCAIIHGNSIALQVVIRVLRQCVCICMVDVLRSHACQMLCQSSSIYPSNQTMNSHDHSLRPARLRHGCMRRLMYAWL